MLINIKMVTEGTDIPDVQAVFITRETKSDILVTQMIGRALRSPRMEWTKKAYIAFLKKVRYALCPRSPMPTEPYAQSYLIFRSKGYI